MSNKSIMKTASFMTRRKVIIYIIITILVLGIVAGFTDPFISDNTVHTAQFGETIVMEAEPPASGTPDDYDLISNLKFAAYKLHHASFFRGETNGKTEADLGITTYTQNVFNKRVATADGVVFAETISSSSMKSVAEQKYADNGIIIFRPSTSVNGNSATFADTAYRMSYEDYSQKYGTIPNQLSKYIINEKTILGVEDENAKTKSAARVSAPKKTADADSNSEEVGFDFYVPENLVRGDDGNYKFTLTLDPEESTRYYRNEVRTLGGADQNPKFYSAKLTITIDENWNPISVYTVENYDIAIPVLGAMNCTGTLLETFSQIGDDAATVPERDFFQPYVDSARDDPDYIPPDIPGAQDSPADYLATAFADYLSGEKNLELKVDLAVGDLTAYDLILSLNLGTSELQLMLGELYVKYSGDTVNVKMNDINGYMSVSDFTELMQNDRLAALVGSLGNFDIMSLFGGDILGTVFNDCEMTSENGITRIHMPFALDTSALAPGIDGIGVDASIYINDEDKSLRSINGDISVAGHSVTVDAAPLERSPIFPSTEGATDLSGILDYIPDLLELADSKAFGISGNVSFMGQTFDINAYIDIRDGLKVDATVSAFGADVSVKYVNDTIYVGIGNIDIRGTVDELPALTELLLGDARISYYINMLKMMLPATINDFTGIIRSLDVSETELTIGLNFLTAPIVVSLERDGNGIVGLDFSIDFDLFDISFDAAADLDIAIPEFRDIIQPSGDEYISFTQLAELAQAVLPYTQSENFAIELNGSAVAVDETYTITANLAITADLDMAGSVTALGKTADIIYTNGTLYAAVDGKKFKLAAADIDALKTPVMRIVDMFVDISNAVPNLSDIVPNAVESISSLTMSGSTINALISIDGNDIAVSFDAQTGSLRVNGAIADIIIDATANVTIPNGAVTIAPPTDAENYFDVSHLSATLDRIADLAESKALDAQVAVDINGTKLNLAVKAALGDGLEINISEPSLPLDITVKNGTAYIAFADIRVSGTPSDIPAALDAFADVIPQDVLDGIRSILAMLDNAPDIKAIFSAALTAIDDLSIDDNGIRLAVVYDGISAQLYCSLALDEISVAIATDDMTVNVDVSRISFERPVFPDINEEEYAPLCEVIAALSAVMPLAKEQAFDLSVNAKIFDTAVRGNIYIGVNNGIQIDAHLTLGDLPVRMTVIDGYIYLSIGSTIRVYEQLTEQALLEIADELENFIPDAKNVITAVIEYVKSMTVQRLLGMLSVGACDNGFAVTVGFDVADIDATIAVEFKMAGGYLRTVGVDFITASQTVSISFDAEIVGDTLVSLDCVDADIMGIPLSLGLGISGTTARNITVGSGYVDANKIVKLISPITAVAKDAAGVKSITLDLNAFVLTSDNAQTSAKGSITLSLAPLAIQAEIVLFEGTADEVTVSATYAQNTVYLSAGNIKLSFNTETDLLRIYNIIEKYMPGYTPEDPGYLNDELAKLFGLKEGASAFNNISLLIERLKQISTAPDTRALFEMLFTGINGLSNDSALKTIANMIGIFERDGDVGISVTVMGITLNVIPRVDETDGVAVLTDISVDATLFGQYVRLSVPYFDLSAEELTVAPPDDGQTYVSVAEFIDAIDNAVGTFTTKNEDGDITFELNTFNFDYEIYAIETTTDENGNAVNVKDEAGRDKPLTDENGNKVKSDTVKVYNKPGYPALRGMFKKYDVQGENGEVVDTSYKFNLEAHIVFEMQSFTFTSPITLDLYVINDAENSGTVFLDYMEGNGNGERIYIDYESVMQLVAAVMDVINVDEELMEELLGDYRLDVDTTVFGSMGIAGLDTVKALMSNVAQAVRVAKSAMSDISSAWNEIATAGSIDCLRDRIDNIKSLAMDAIEKIKSIVALFATETEQVVSDDETDIIPDGATELNGKLFHDIVFGVTLEKTGNVIKATMDNALLTGTDGISKVVVTQNNNKIDSITVGNLDVNTAKLNDFTAKFTAGGEVNISAPTDFANTAPKGSTYSDFTKIKHLLFDVMNTANMLEFEIGDLNSDSEEYINLNVLSIINVNIKYSVKVKIIDLGKDSKPRYKTAADITLDVPGYHTNAGKATLFGLAKCTPRIFFYDNVLYVHGVESWSGNVSGSIFTGGYKYNYNVTYSDAAYTINELMTMLNSDNGIERLFNDVVFKVLPLMKSFLGINIHEKIIDSVKNPPAAEDKLNTLAQIFKGYTYDSNTYEHTLVIGLKELALNGSLNDVTIKLKGANDGDDNILDNYIQSAYIETNFAGVADMKLSAKLNNTVCNTHYYSDEDYTIPSPDNAPTDYGRVELESKTLGTTTIDGKQYTLTGDAKNNYGSIIDELLAVATIDGDGNIISLTNRANGIQWTRPWQTV